jgi:hypothetical protein
MSVDPDSKPILGGTIRVGTGREAAQVKVTADWTHGLDSRRSDWTSLWSYLIRKLAAEARTAAVQQAGDVAGEV